MGAANFLEKAQKTREAPQKQEGRGDVGELHTPARAQHPVVVPAGSTRSQHAREPRSHPSEGQNLILSLCQSLGKLPPLPVASCSPLRIRLGNSRNICTRLSPGRAAACPYLQRGRAPIPPAVPPTPGAGSPMPALPLHPAAPRCCSVPSQPLRRINKSAKP